VKSGGIHGGVIFGCLTVGISVIVVIDEGCECFAVSFVAFMGADISVVVEGTIKNKNGMEKF
jgi:hypothetical protein